MTGLCTLKYSPGWTCTRLDRSGERRPNGGVRQFFFRQMLAGFARNQQRLQTFDFLQRKLVAGLRTLKSARRLIQLLLRNQVVFEHRLSPFVFLLGVEAVGFGALHRCQLFRILRRRVVRTKIQAERAPVAPNLVAGRTSNCNSC